MSELTEKDLDTVHKACGKIESINGQCIRGWIYLDNDVVPEIEVFVNGVRLTSINPEINRPRLQKKIGTESNCGFIVRFTDPELLNRQKMNKIEIIETNSGFCFGREFHFYCPLVRKLKDNLQNVFFAEYYRRQHGLDNLTNEEAIDHYLQTGIYLDHNPNPWFSSSYFRKKYSHKLNNIDIPILAYLNFESSLEVRASEYFNPAYYANNNPDLSVEAGLLNHYVNYGHLENRRGDDCALPASIHRETESLSEIEPSLALYFNTRKNVVEYPTLRVSTFIPRLVGNKYGNRIKAVICVPYLSCGGADLISTYVLRAYQEVYGTDHVLLIVTDRSENVVPQWIAQDSQVVYLDEEAKYTNFDEKVRTLHSIVGLLSPEKIININSHASWEMYRVYGRQLATVIDLYAYLFCFDYAPDNRVAGYIVDYVPKTIKCLKKVFCDNQMVIDDMQRLYGFSEKNYEAFKAVYVPIPDNLNRIEHSQCNPYRKKILWISRLARQKRPELLLKIAEDMPDHAFVVYGPPGDSNVSRKIIKNKIGNIEYRGVFDNISDLNLDEYSFFLNTSAWDGLPTILIQIMGAGLPIVTSNAGGISELVNHQTGTLVLDHDDSDAYCFAIKKALVNYNECLMRSKAGFDLITDRHSWSSFRTRLESIGAFDDLYQTTRRVIPQVDRREYGG